jgi:hypothetical protein
MENHGINNTDRGKEPYTGRKCDVSKLLMETEVSYFPELKAGPSQDIPIEFALSIIKSGEINGRPVVREPIEQLRASVDPQIKKELKLKLPSFTFL